MNMFFQQACYTGTIVAAALMSLEGLRSHGVTVDSPKFKNVYDAYSVLLEGLGADLDVLTLLEMVALDPDDAQRQVRAECMADAANAVSLLAEERVGRKGNFIHLDEYNELVRKHIPSKEDMDALVAKRREELDKEAAEPKPRSGTLEVLLSALGEIASKQTVSSDT